MSTEPKKVTEIWAWIVTEADGSEGVPAMIASGQIAPMLGADEERVRSYEAMARSCARGAGLPLKLMRFSHAEILETYDAG